MRQMTDVLEELIRLGMPLIDDSRGDDYTRIKLVRKMLQYIERRGKAIVKYATLYDRFNTELLPFVVRDDIAMKLLQNRKRKCTEDIRSKKKPFVKV